MARPHLRCSTAPGNIGVGIDATLTGPRGNAISGGVNDNRTTLTDVFYQGTLKWNQGVHNEMVYVTGNIPSGTYDSTRLAEFQSFDSLRSMSAPAIPISTRRPATNSPWSAASPTIS